MARFWIRKFYPQCETFLKTAFFNNSEIKIFFGGALFKIGYIGTVEHNTAAIRADPGAAVWQGSCHLNVFI